MIVGGVVWGHFFAFSVCVCVCLGVQRGLGRVLIKYSGNVRLQRQINLDLGRMFYKRIYFKY